MNPSKNTELHSQELLQTTAMRIAEHCVRPEEARSFGVALELLRKREMFARQLEMQLMEMPLLQDASEEVLRKKAEELHPYAEHMTPQQAARFFAAELNRDLQASE